MSDEGVQEALVGSDPQRFFRPPYVGGEASRRLVALLDARAGGHRS